MRDDFLIIILLSYKRTIYEFHVLITLYVMDRVQVYTSVFFSLTWFLSVVTVHSLILRPRQNEAAGNELDLDSQEVGLLPSDIRPKELNNFKIPSDEFCSKMELRSSDMFMVLPWWYHYCAKMKEKQHKKYQDKQYYLPYYWGVLDRLRFYKEQQRMKSQRNINESVQLI